MKLPLPRWIAHRGGGSLAPENTLAGLRLAARLGYRAVEFDVMLSADGTPFLIHDETLARTTNGDGRVCATPDGVLLTLDAGGGERIPTMAAAAALCRQYGLLANVEIKPAAGYERQTAEVVARHCVALWQEAEILPLISSFSMEALAIARDLAPAIPRGLLFDAVPADWHRQLLSLGGVTLHCNARQVRSEVLAEAAAQAVPVLCYTVNSVAASKKLLASGVSAMFTDRLDLFAGPSRVRYGQEQG